MRKLVASFFVVMSLLMNITSFAATDTKDVYFGADNSVHFTDDNSSVSDFTTVLIRKSGTTGANGVVYVDQQKYGFSDAVNFMLKAGVRDGDYVAVFGNADNQTKMVNFFVGDIEITGTNSSLKLNQDNKMSIADEPVEQEGLYGDVPNGTYKKGFVFNATSEQYNSFNRLYLVSEDGKTCYGYFNIEKETVVTDGEVAYGIQIYNIPVDRKGMNLYLGEESK